MVRPDHAVQLTHAIRAHSNLTRAVVCKSVELLAGLGHHLVVLPTMVLRYPGLACGVLVGPGGTRVAVSNDVMVTFHTRVGVGILRFLEFMEFSDFEIP